MVRYRCDPGEELHEELAIPSENPQKSAALILSAQYRMSEVEIRRRKLTGTLEGASLERIGRDAYDIEDSLSCDTASADFYQVYMGCLLSIIICTSSNIVISVIFFLSITTKQN